MFRVRMTIAATTSFVETLQLPIGAPVTIYNPAVVSFPLTTPAAYTISFFGTDQLGNSEAIKTLAEVVKQP